MHYERSVPFGQDRLIPIWIATLALRQKSREVHFDSAAQMLDFFRLPKDGFHYRRLVEAFKRIFGATIFFGTEEQSAAKTLIDWTQILPGWNYIDSLLFTAAASQHQIAVDGPEAKIATAFPRG